MNFLLETFKVFYDATMKSQINLPEVEAELFSVIRSKKEYAIEFRIVAIYSIYAYYAENNSIYSNLLLITPLAPVK